MLKLLRLGALGQFQRRGRNAHVVPAMEGKTMAWYRFGVKSYCYQAEVKDDGRVHTNPDRLMEHRL